MILNRRRVLLWLLGSIVLILLVLSAIVNHHPDSNKIRSKNHNNNNGLYDEKDVAVHLRSNHRQAEYIDKKGVHVVVGRYVGDSINNVNLTYSEINGNRYNPEVNAGADGDPVFLKPSEERLSKRLYHVNKFNIVASDKIPLNRSLPDFRRKSCPDTIEGLPDASVIIVFHNEAWSTLLRTVHSVINRSPISLLREIILVDDCSNRTFLGRKQLEEHVSKLSVSVRILTNSERVGLVKARLKGAGEAKGTVLLFLDAHCEATEGWLQPLLARIRESRTALVCPVIDIINDDTFAYTRAFSMHWGGFNWELHFRWFAMGKTALEEYSKDPTKPYGTPVMAGGLFAVDKDYFFELGSYDEKMDIWGGENLELSFRAWMCGGSVEIAPCSRVGHVFRKASPYDFPRDGGVSKVLNANLARVALVWMDDMAEFYFGGKNKEMEQDVAERKELRRRLRCKDFNWYLDTVWPQHFFPTEGREVGLFRHKTSGLCLQKPFSAAVGSHGQTGSVGGGPATLKECSHPKDFFASQMVVVTKEGYLMSDESLCLDSPTAAYQEESGVRYQACAESERQKWRYEDNMVVKHRETGKCLSHPTAGTSDALTLRKCTGATDQEWTFEPLNWREKS